MKPNEPDEIFFDGMIHDSQWADHFQHPDIAFWIDLAKTFGPKVLELACGTGRITIPAFESGVDIEGLDFSESMLCIARERAAAKSLPIHFYNEDIRTITFHDQYDFIFLPSGTISHLITRPDLEKFFAGVHQALHKAGVLALDVHNPTNTWLRSLPLEQTSVLSSFQINATQETIMVETSRQYRSDTQILTICNKYTFPDGSTREGTIVLKAYFPVELQSLLYYNGFIVSDILGDYERDTFNSSTRKYVVLARPVT